MGPSYKKNLLFLICFAQSHTHFRFITIIYSMSSYRNYKQLLVLCVHFLIHRGFTCIPSGARVNRFFIKIFFDQVNLLLFGNKIMRSFENQDFVE